MIHQLEVIDSLLVFCKLEVIGPFQVSGQREAIGPFPMIGQCEMIGHRSHRRFTSGSDHNGLRSPIERR